MTQEQEPYFDINYMAEGQVNSFQIYNDAINRLGANIQASIKDRDLSTPPGSPSEGDRYLVKATGAGDWAGEDGNLAVYFNGWIFIEPKEGWNLWVDDENIRIEYNGSAWNALPDQVPTFTPYILTNSDSAGDLEGNPSEPVRFDGDYGYVGMGPGITAAPTDRHKIDGITRIGDPEGSDYSEFDADGHQTMAGTARVWKEMHDFGIFNFFLDGAASPGNLNVDNFYFHDYDKNNTEKAFALLHVPDDFVVGTGSLKVKFPFMPKETSGVTEEGVRWGVEYKRISAGDVFSFSSGTTTTEITTAVSASTPQYEWIENAEITLNTTGWVAGETIALAIYRNGSHADDDYDNGALVGDYHAEYLSDRIGTKST